MTGTVLLLRFAGPLSAAQSASPPYNGARDGAVFIEYYRSQDSDRDIDVFMIGADDVTNLLGQVALSGAAGIVLIRGARILEDVVGLPRLDADALGTRFLGSLRISPIRLGPLHPFLDVGFGMVFTTRAFPPGGTTWNFTRRYSVGTGVALAERAMLIVAVARTHVSNGKGFGHPRNPAYDGAGVLIGIGR